MMSDVTTAPADFVALCERLYGDVIDPDAVWEEVHKAAPDSADLKTQRNARIRRNVERSSNALGITAGSLGLAASLKDERMDPSKNPSAGRVARALHHTGKKMPEFAQRIATKHPRLGAGLAATAVGAQVANLGGDALIAGTLGEKKKAQRPTRHRAGQPLSKADVAKFKVPSVGGDIRTMASNVQTMWNPELAKGPALPKLRSVPPAAQGGPRGAAVRQNATVSPAAAAPPAQPTTRQGVKNAREAKATEAKTAKHRSWGADFSQASGTRTGKIVGGGLLATGAVKAKPNRQQGGYDPYMGYAKRDDDVVFRGEFSKFDDAKQQAFGWASIVRKDGSPVVDKQGDYITIEDLEDAGYTYVQKSRVGGDMHARDGEGPRHVSDMIESMIFTPEKIEKMGLPEGFPQGWWVGYQIHDAGVWDEVRKRGRTGFSIHGKGLRKDHDLDELMGY
jgi:Putative phage serine protease XkdF